MGYISFDSPWLDPSNDVTGATCWKDGDHWTASDEGWTLEDLWELGWKTDSRGVPQFVKAYGCTCRDGDIQATGRSVREAGMKVSRAIHALVRQRVLFHARDPRGRLILDTADGSQGPSVRSSSPGPRRQ